MHVTERADAARLLKGQYFDMTRESAFVRVLRLDVDRYSASSFWGLAIRPPHIRGHRSAIGALSQGTVTANAKQKVASVVMSRAGRAHLALVLVFV